MNPGAPPEAAARPHPLRDAAASHAPVPTLAGAAATALLLLGVIDPARVDVLTLALGAAAVLVTAVTSLLTTRRVVRAGEHDVTPLEAPRGPGGEVLVARDEQMLGQVLARLVEQLTALRAGPPAAQPEPTPPPTAPMPATSDPRRPVAEIFAEHGRDAHGRHVPRDPGRAGR